MRAVQVLRGKEVDTGGAAGYNISEFEWTRQTALAAAMGEFMAYQLIAVDMDGTLLNSKKEITPRSAAAVRAALERGYHVAIATGRCYRQIQSYFALFPEMRCAITSSGAAIADRRDDRIVRSSDLPADVAARLVEASLASDVFPILFTEGHALYRPDLFAEMERYDIALYRGTIADACTPTPNLEQQFLRTPHPLEKIDLYFASPDERAAYLARVEGVHAQITPCDYAGLEINASSVDKGTGLAALCDYLHIPLSDAIAIGDAENDVSMLRAAGLAVAMGNALDAVKAEADVIAPDCDHDGVADVIERYLLAQT